jgi:propanol-preferring alcohol dehydrogenase
MKAALLREFNKPLSIEEIETPRPGPDDVLIKMMACGVDGTDLKLLAGFGYVPDLPFVLGHECTGVVEQAGSAVTDFKPGDRVIAYNFFTCGKCRLCRTHREQLCPNMSGVLGCKDLPGGYAEFLKLPARQVANLPDGVSWTDAATLCDAGITAFHAVDRADLDLGETVVIFGVGGVGSFAVQFAHLSGARVIAVDQTQEKCARALELGASEAFVATEKDIPTAVRDLTDGWGADCVIDIVGLKSTMTCGVDSLRNGGRIVIVGYTADEYPVSGKRLAQNELQLIGTRCGRKQDLINTAKMVASGKTRSIVTDTRPFAEVNDALDLLKSGKVLGRLVLQHDAR